MSPRSRFSRSASDDAVSRVCSPSVDTRAANSTSASRAAERTSSTVISDRNSGSTSVTAATVPTPTDTYARAVLPLVLAVATAVVGGIGWLFWRGDGQLRRGSGERIRPREAALPEDAFGAVATLVLFGSQQDERTVLVRQQLAGLIEGRPGVLVAEVDLTLRGDLAGRFAVTRTPSVFALDRDGRLRARVSGAADLDTLRRALETAIRPAG